MESWDAFLNRLARRERDVEELGGFADEGVVEGMTAAREAARGDWDERLDSLICLDNDVFSRYASPHSYSAVTAYLAAHSEQPWLLPSIVPFQYLQQYDEHDTIREQRRRAEESVDDIIPVDGDIAAQGAILRARLAAVGTALAVPDLLIVAAARERNCTLVTCNGNGFDKDSIHQLLDVDILGAESPQ